MKLIVVLLSLTFFLAGCCHWRVNYPPGYTHADFERDEAICNHYTRTWCANYGQIIVSGTTTYGGAVVYGSRSCNQSQFDTVFRDCLTMKGYHLELICK